jgi:DNA-binding transcriptional regulator YiaG
MSWNRGKGEAIAWLRAMASYHHEECLIWPFTRNSQKGYGTFGYLRQQHYAHRYMCELVHGPAPSPKHQAAHSCGRGHEGCVNPGHLSWKTNSENQIDRSEHGNRGPVQKRLSPREVAEVRALKGIKTQVEIAAMYGVKVGCIEYWHRHDKQPARPGGSLSHRYKLARLAKASHRDEQSIQPAGGADAL